MPPKNFKSKSSNFDSNSPNSSVQETNTGSTAFADDELVIDQVLSLSDDERIAAVILGVRVEAVDNISALIAEFDAAFGCDLLNWLAFNSKFVFIMFKHLSF